MNVDQIGIIGIAEELPAEREHRKLQRLQEQVQRNKCHPKSTAPRLMQANRTGLTETQFVSTVKYPGLTRCR